MLILFLIKKKHLNLSFLKLEILLQVDVLLPYIKSIVTTNFLDKFDDVKKLLSETEELCTSNKNSQK